MNGSAPTQIPKDDADGFSLVNQGLTLVGIVLKTTFRNPGRFGVEHL